MRLGGARSVSCACSPYGLQAGDGVTGKIAARVEIPRRLRALVRARESSLILLAAMVGVIAGLVVVVMGDTVDLLHEVLFDLQHGERLSARLTLNPILALSVPLVGGLLFGGISELISRWRPEREIDPIEANALHGGRMSLLGSIIVAAQTVWSSGVGASVGLEAGYTQFAAGIASRIGIAFRLRRGDLRILVGCGAAAGIAGAFGAPLAGAFYGFELIIGSYTPTSCSRSARITACAIMRGLLPLAWTRMAYSISSRTKGGRSCRSNMSLANS